MEIEEKFNYWLDIAIYDLETAHANFSAGRYAYVAFMCEQAIEKLIKGLICFYCEDEIPRVHNLVYLLAKLPKEVVGNVESDTIDLLNRLSSYYLQGRYPSYKEKISEMVDAKEAEHLLNKSKEVFSWLQALKK